MYLLKLSKITFTRIQVTKLQMQYLGEKGHYRCMAEYAYIQFVS